MPRENVGISARDGEVPVAMSRIKMTAPVSISSTQLGTLCGSGLQQESTRNICTMWP